MCIRDRRDTYRVLTTTTTAHTYILRTYTYDVYDDVGYILFLYDVWYVHNADLITWIY